MDFNIDVRKKQLESLDQYITSSKDKVQSILDYLGWNTKKNVEAKEPEILCSVNPGHVVAQKTVEDHLKNCFFKTMGYQSDEKFLSEPVNDPFTSITLDQTKKIEVLSKARENNQRFKAAWNGQDSDPMTSDRLFTTFSSDERLVLYDYCVKNTEHPPVPSEFNIQMEDRKEEKFLTQQELLSKERDAKRRRIKYKSVHTSRNKNYTEVMREVIDNQMEQYKDYLASKSEINSCQTAANTDQGSKQQNVYQTSTDGDTLVKDNANDMERPSSSVSRHSNQSGNTRTKKNYTKYENHSHDPDHRRNYRDYDKRHDYNNKYSQNSHKESRRYKDFEDDYRHSRDKRGWSHRTERRH